MTCTPAHQLLAERLRRPPAPCRSVTGADATLLISIKPHCARMIERGGKGVEFRRRFPAGISSGRAIFYLTSPLRQIAMTARIARVERAAQRALWRQFVDIAGTSRAEFDAYFADAPRGVALLLDQVHRLSRPLHLDDILLGVPDFRPPRSLAILPNDSPLLELLPHFYLAPAEPLA